MSDSSLPESDSSEEVKTEAGEFRFVGNYGLLFRLGEGGMGEVWAARDGSSPKNRVIALKTTKQEGTEAAKVLYDEARIASMIEHPNVCRVHHLGRAKDIQYLVMDYCDGTSLHDLLEASPGKKLPIDIACRVLSGASAGLHAAHELTDEDGTRLGVVHRDVSPQNILISTKGEVTVVDFGVAKALGQAHKATETGEMKGKLSYMAPEQVTSKDIDARADVFALGCVLYQMTLGKRPFHGADALATLYQLLEEELVLPTQVEPEFPPQLEAVIQKALSKDREGRYVSAAEFQRALEEVLLHNERRPTDDDVASFLMSRLGDSIQQKKSAIKNRNEALNRFDRAERSGTVRVERAQSVATPTDETGTRVGSARKSRVKYAPALVFLVVVVGGILALRSFRADPPQPDDPSSVSSNSPQVEPPSVDPDLSTKKVESVRVDVNAMPPSAVIRIDGEKVGEGTYSETVASSSKAHVLEMSAKGYRSVTRALVFDRSQSITIELSPIGKPEKLLTQPKPIPPPSTKPHPKPGLPKPKPGRPPRKLDSDNPFAGP